MANKKIKEDAQKADELWQKTYGEGGETNTDNTEPTEPVEPAVQEPEPQAEPQQPSASLEDVMKQVEELKKQYDTSEQRYRVLQGKYDAELPRKEYENMNLRMQLEELQKKSAPSKQDLEKEQILTQRISKLSEEYPEINDGVEARISVLKSEIRNELLREFQQEIAPLKTDKESTFQREFNRLVPDWQDYQHDNGFAQWLDSRDRYTGGTRRNLLVGAYNNKDADTVSNFYNDYKEIIGKKSTPGTVVKDTANVVTDTTTNVEKTVAPPRTGRVSSQIVDDLNTITGETINKFFADKRKHWKEASPKERDEMMKKEALIMKAVEEGKVK